MRTLHMFGLFTLRVKAAGTKSAHPQQLHHEISRRCPCLLNFHSRYTFWINSFLLIVRQVSHIKADEIMAQKLNFTFAKVTVCCVGRVYRTPF